MLDLLIPNIHHLSWQQAVVYILLVQVLFYRVICGAIADVMRWAIKKIYLRSRHDLILWYHIKGGHGRHHPLECQKDHCASYDF
jgi:hypothetical protein